DRLLPRYSAAKTALHWLAWNALGELIWGRSGRYMLVQYDDFARDPQGVVRGALAMLGESEKPISPPFIGSHEVILHVNHTVAGNPGRFREGPVKIRQDNEWEKAIRPLDRWTVNVLAWPLMWRYGYPRREG
ncbi:MAG: sulfotransferase, partial [Chloroflexi bacterium]|nr:sulfotransferase [Chloroflexota bacterium]